MICRWCLLASATACGLHVLTPSAACAAKLGEPGSRLLRPQHRRQWQVGSWLRGRIAAVPLWFRRLALLQECLTASQAPLRAPLESKGSSHLSRCCFCSQCTFYRFITHLQAAQLAHVLHLETRALRLISTCGVRCSMFCGAPITSVHAPLECGWARAWLQRTFWQG